MKKIEKKPILIAIGLVIFQSICYQLSRSLEGTPHLIGSAIDEAIPFNIHAVIPYASWFFLSFIIPYLLYKKDKNNLSKYCLTYCFMTLIANIIFIIYPTTVIRPEVSGNNLLELMTRIIFWVDTPIQNCFPSLHCAISMIWALFIIESKYTSKKEKIIYPIISILIMVSTLFLKQHVLIDLISGDILAVIIYYIIKKENNLTNRLKKLLKI